MHTGLLGVLCVPCLYRLHVEICSSFLKFVGVVGVGGRRLCIYYIYNSNISTCVRGVSHFNYACVVDGSLRD